jgi:hypothetical protein
MANKRVAMGKSFLFLIWIVLDRSCPLIRLIRRSQACSMTFVCVKEIAHRIFYAHAYRMYKLLYSIIMFRLGFRQF